MLITDRTAPPDVPTTDALASIPDDLLQTPPAYLTFGTTPAALENPPSQGDVEIYMVRARCSAEHGPIERKDGEMRYTRTMVVQAIWKPGEKEPVTDDQPALLNPDGEANPDAIAGDPDAAEELDTQDPDAAEGEGEGQDDLDAHDPEFSSKG